MGLSYCHSRRSSPDYRPCRPEIHTQPVNPLRQADTLRSPARISHTVNEKVNVFVYGLLFSFESTPTESGRQPFGYLAVPYWIPFPDKATMFVISVVVDLCLGEKLEGLLVGAIQIYRVFSL